MRTVVGIDLGLATTAIVWQTGEAVRSQIITYPKLPKGAGDRQRIERLHYFTEEIVKHLRFIAPDVSAVGIEGYAFAAVGRVFHIAELGGAVRYALYRELGLEAQTIGIMVARKLALGAGNLKKMAVAKRVRRLHKFATLDECDAFCVMRALQGNVAPAVRVAG